MNNEELSQVLLDRRASLERLITSGVPPFAYAYDRTHLSADAHALLPDGADSGPSVRIAGRLVSLRSKGKTAFAHVSDASGRLQAYFRKDDMAPVEWAVFEELHLGDIVGVAGGLMRTRTGEVTVQCTELTLLAKTLRPLPFAKEQVVDGETKRYSGFTDPEQRYRQRYADLAVHPEVRANFYARDRKTSCRERVSLVV